MYLSSQGMNFLGLTARKYETANISNKNLNEVHKKLGSFEQVSNGFAQTKLALTNLKDNNCQAYFLADGEKKLISDKAWDRGGMLEGKLPLEEGIAKGLYQIENIQTQAEPVDLDRILEELKAQAVSDAGIPSAPSPKSVETSKFQNKFDVKKDSSFGFMS